MTVSWMIIPQPLNGLNKLWLLAPQPVGEQRAPSAAAFVMWLFFDARRGLIIHQGYNKQNIKNISPSLLPQPTLRCRSLYQESTPMHLGLRTRAHFLIWERLWRALREDTLPWENSSRGNRHAPPTPPSSRGSSGQAGPCVCQGKQESSSWFNNTGTCENMGSAPRIKPNKPTLAWRRASSDDRCHSTVATPGQ